MDMGKCPHCHTYVLPSSQGVCPQCQRNVNDPPDASIPPVPVVSAGPRQRVPIARVCPACGCAEYTLVKPEALVAYAYDRLCLRCRTRYAIPTPVWASVTFIVFGLALAAVCALGIVLRALRPDDLASPAIIVECLLAAMGALSVVHGFRCLRRGG
jgi:hypothetical protein